MGTVVSIAKRTARVYLRDRPPSFSPAGGHRHHWAVRAVSAQTQVDSIKNSVGDVEGIRFLVDSWIMSGILVVNSITVTLGVLGTMIDDSARKRLSGFLVAPIRRSSLVWGYLVSSWIVGIALCLLALVLAEIYILIGGGTLLAGPALLKTVGVIVLNVLSASSMMLFIMTFIRTPGGFVTLSTIVGTFVGFLTGIYVPIGVLPEAVQTAIKCVPFSYPAVLLRQIFMEEPLSRVFAGAPAAAADAYMTTFGVTMKVAGRDVNALTDVFWLTATGLVFFLLSALRMRFAATNDRPEGAERPSSGRGAYSGPDQGRAGRTDADVLEGASHEIQETRKTQ